MAQLNIKKSPTVNNFTTSLNGAISDTATTVNLNSVTGLQNAAGILVVDRVDTSGNLTPTKQEWLYFTGVSGLAVTLPNTSDGRGVAGSTAQSHSDGAIVEAVMDVSAWGGLITSYISQHSDAGTHTAITGNTIGLVSNASIAGNVFSNTLNTASTASISGNLNAKNIIATNISMLSVASIADNSITANSLATGAITLGYAAKTDGFTMTGTTKTLITGLETTVTIPAGGRKVKITAFCGVVNVGTAAHSAELTIWDGVVGVGTQIADASMYGPTNAGFFLLAIAVATPSAGSKTYRAALNADSGGVDVNLFADATQPAFILVELI